MCLTDHQKYVIRGIMKTDEGNISNDTANKIYQALWSIFKEVWTIVIYRCGSYETELGYGDQICYDSTWYISGHRRNTCGPTSYSELTPFLQSRFGFFKISDASAFKNAVEVQVNERFSGNWRVHLVKLKPSFSWYGDAAGTWFDHDGYRLFVMAID
jgi:hypothetical protein